MLASYLLARLVHTSTKPEIIGRRSSRLKTFAGIDSTCVSVLSGTIRPIISGFVSKVFICGIASTFLHSDNGNLLKIVHKHSGPLQHVIVSKIVHKHILGVFNRQVTKLLNCLTKVSRSFVMVEKRDSQNICHPLYYPFTRFTRREGPFREGPFREGQRAYKFRQE